jgi:ABC-type antimicrobial peptide transport system permease subunit
VERRSILIIGGAVLIGLAVFVAWSLGPGRNRNESPRLTEITDPAAIRNTVELTHLSIATSDTFAGNIRIRNITGRLKNISTTPIRKIDLKMTFTDYDGKTIQESTHTAFSPRKQPLDPGTQFQFEINFENLPKSWNYHVPTTQIVSVAY